MCKQVLAQWQIIIVSYYHDRYLELDSQTFIHVLYTCITNTYIR